jgi:hypothetical protein
MIACFGGWSLDALDVMIFTFVILSLLVFWHITSGEAGVLATVTLLVSPFGGWIAGALADRFGRVRILQVAILWYAVFTFLCGFPRRANRLVLRLGRGGFVVYDFLRHPAGRYGVEGAVLDREIERRVEGHLFISVLAYDGVHTLRLQLKAKGINEAWETTRNTLSTQARITTTLHRRDGRSAH